MRARYHIMKDKGHAYMEPPRAVGLVQPRPAEERYLNPPTPTPPPPPAPSPSPAPAPAPSPAPAQRGSKSAHVSTFPATLRPPIWGIHVSAAGGRLAAIVGAFLHRQERGGHQHARGQCRSVDLSTLQRATPTKRPATESSNATGNYSVPRTCRSPARCRCPSSSRRCPQFYLASLRCPGGCAQSRTRGAPARTRVAVAGTRAQARNRTEEQEVGSSDNECRTHRSVCVGARLETKTVAQDVVQRRRWLLDIIPSTLAAKGKIQMVAQ